jgi:predicted DCC family thiol-disulfide oxidoreductase YuxK
MVTLDQISVPEEQSFAAAPACLTVFHDGSCPLCRREIAMAKRLTEGTGVAFVDVSSVRDAMVAPGLTASAAMRRFHVQRADGVLLSGAPAFIEMWSQAPRMRWVAKIAHRPWLLAGLDRLYSGFLIMRPAISSVLRRLER